MGELVQLIQNECPTKIERILTNGWGDTMDKIQYWRPEGSDFFFIRNFHSRQNCQQNCQQNVNKIVPKRKFF